MSKPVQITTDKVSTAVLDAARAVARLDSAAMMPRVEVCFIDGQQWTYQEVIDAVAFHLLSRMRASLSGANTYGVPLATVTAMLAALGATQSTINLHGQAVAKSMRRDWRNGS